MPRPKRPWPEAVERQGVTVRVYERAVGSVLYLESRDSEGAKQRKSVGHRDQTLAVQQARAVAERVAELRHAGTSGPLTLGQLAALYNRERLPLLSPARQRRVRGMVRLLERHFGRAFRVEDLSEHHVDAYAPARRTGAVKSPRHRVPGDGVRDRTIRNEDKLLATMLRWARGYKVNGVLRTTEAMECALALTGQPVAAAAQWPHGALRFRAERHKRGVETVVPVSREVREALDVCLTAHPRVGEAPLFPATGDDVACVSKVLAGYWLRRAETLAGLPRLERGAWHAFRRLWASERRHLRAQDVIAAGGWRSAQVMQTAYRHDHAATVSAVVSHAPNRTPAKRGPGRAGRGGRAR
jgi:integrase